MVHHEDEVWADARDLFDQKAYQKMRNFIWNHHGALETDGIKLKLLHLWEDSLYQEFIDNRTGGQGASNPVDSKAVLSSSMRYKLRKKHPCPIELEHEMRVKNARLPKTVHDGLNSWLKKHRDNPYPNKVEKEALSAKLGITPQQVNRWFIQRRKMLRIRGNLYLGRGITDTTSDPEADDSNSHDMEDTKEHLRRELGHLQPEPRSDGHLLPPPPANLLLLFQQQQQQQDLKPDIDGNYPLLEKILTSPRNSPNLAQQQQQIMINKGVFTGGSVEVMEEEMRRYKMELEAVANGSELPLTPPPSISGDSNARSTPPEVNGYTDFHAESPLDLSCKEMLLPKKPVILEPVSPPWKSAIPREGVELFPYKPEDFELKGEKSKLVVAEEEELDSAEKIAVNALLCLSKGGL